MSVTSEFDAVTAAITAVLVSVVPASSPDNVDQWVLPEPCTIWPQIVLSRPHWTITEINAGGEKGNDDNNPSIYVWEYFDQLISQTGSTVKATMDAHDAFLEALVLYFQSSTGHYLADGAGIRQVNAAGQTITSTMDKRGPYDLAAGSSTLLSEGQLTVKGLNRPVLP
jgi:hypothetical protein